MPRSGMEAIQFLAEERVNRLIGEEPLSEIETVVLAGVLVKQGTTLMRMSQTDADAIELLTAVIEDIKDSQS